MRRIILFVLAVFLAYSPAFAVQTGGAGSSNPDVLKGASVEANMLTVEGTAKTSILEVTSTSTKIGTVQYIWPSTQGGATTYLQNNGSGTLTWGTISGTVPSPGGDGYTLLGNGGAWTTQPLLGDITVTKTGIVTIAANAVTTDEIAAGSINAAKIADGIIPGTKLTSSIAITTSGNITSTGTGSIAAGSIAGKHFGDGANLTNVAPSGSAGGDLTGNYPNPTIGANKIVAAYMATDSVTAGAIAANAVTTTEIANGSISAAKIADGIIPGTKLTSSIAITTSGNITSTGTGSIAAGSIAGKHFGDGANLTNVAPSGSAGGDLTGNYPNPTIGANKIVAAYMATDSVTAGAIAANAVTTTEIADGSISAAKIADGIIPGTKLTSSIAITTSGSIAATSFAGNHYGSGAGLTNISPSSLALTSASIFVGNASNQAAAQAVSGDITMTNTGATTIAAGAITGPELADQVLKSGTLNDATYSITLSNEGTGSTAFFPIPVSNGLFMYSGGHKGGVFQLSGSSAIPGAFGMFSDYFAIVGSGNITKLTGTQLQLAIDTAGGSLTVLNDIGAEPIDLFTVDEYGVTKIKTLASDNLYVKASSTGSLSASAIDISSGMTGVLPVAHGGTSVGDFTLHGVVYATTATSLTATGAGASGTVLKGTGIAPAFGKVTTDEIESGSITGIKLASNIVINTTGNISTEGNMHIGTTLEASGRTVYSPSAVNEIAAATGITDAMIAKKVILIKGATALIDISANPQIAGGQNGQEIVLIGTDDDYLVKFDSTTGLQLSAATSFTMGAGDTMQLIYVSSIGKWVEISRTDN